ncbi:hypothetical protein Taro_001996 [Colocasia esculenta]|uniref:Uncharacterized protein n=1 Tax=Colocasia esculenta TaxID=4460 RepID=A0A843TF93_COLES|nr:hypothetical protein [Colocasia esculenta]
MYIPQVYIDIFPQKLKESTRAWGIPQGTIEENKQLTTLLLLHCTAETTLLETYNSNTGVRVSRSDDTDLDGTTQVPGQSPELTAWLTKNLGHPTGEVTIVGVVLLATYTKPCARHTQTT